MFGRVVAPSKAIALLPSALVDSLVAEGIADRLPVVRSSGPISPDLIIGGMQVATVLVTFAQIPETFAYLSEAISRWRRKSGAGEVTLTVTAKGPRGKVSIELDQAVAVPDIEGVLKLVSDEQVEA